MSRELALFLCILLVGCNGGGSKGTATQAGFDTLGSTSDATTGQTPGATSPAGTGDNSSGSPTTGPSGVTGASGDATGNDATGNDVTGNPGTGNPDTGEPEPPGTTGEASTGAVEVSSTGGTTADPSAGPGGEMTTNGGIPQCVPIQCDGKTYDCGDCMDNDGDGKADLADPECVSPCDDREDTFATGIPGDNVDPCKQDCFFDGNSGGGGGDCQWNLKCDLKSPGGDSCPYDPNYKNCAGEQTQECVENCQVPNGCDCFGCCTVTVDGESHDIYLNDPDCSLDHLELCTMCTMNEDCDNPCDPNDCEVCFGEDELPPGCNESSCEEGQQPCEVDEMGGSNCAEGYFCSTGCCVTLVPG